MCMKPNQKKTLTLTAYRETASDPWSVKSMTHYILFHLHDNNKGRWFEQTKVIFDVQHQTTYTWRVWHHNDSKLITQQQTSSCCEDKGLASVCFCWSLNQKTLKRISHERTNLLRKHRIGAHYLSSKKLTHFKSRDFSFQTAIDGLLICYFAGDAVSVYVWVCLCVRFSFLSVCWPCLSGISGKVSVSFLHCWWIMRCD